MRILVIGKFYIEGFALHIAETLGDMGHTVLRYEPGFRRAQWPGKAGHRVDQVRSVIYTATDNLPRLRAARIGSLFDLVEKEKPLDIILVCHDFLWPKEVEDLKRRSRAIVVMWFPDALVNFGRGFFMNAPYDALFFKDPYIVHMLRGVLASQVYYLPECFNPQRHRLPDDDQEIAEEYRCDITTAGNQHSWRVAFFEQLSEFNVKIWGQPAPLWLPARAIAAMHQGRIVLNADKARAFLGAKVVVNNLHYGEVWGLNVRAFEAAGIGAFQMVDWRPGLSQLFEDEQEIISFRNIADLKEKLRFWLPRETERYEIATAGKRRALAEHSYRHRLELMMTTISGNATGFPVSAPQV